MSNRTIVEFNHDYAHEIITDPDGFMQHIAEMLRCGVNGNPENKRGVELERQLERYGVRTVPTVHHSEERRVTCGRYIDKRF